MPGMSHVACPEDGAIVGQQLPQHRNVPQGSSDVQGGEALKGTVEGPVMGQRRC